MPAPLDPKIGDLVILKGGIVGRILGLNVTGRCLRAWEGGDQRKGRVLVQTWYPIEGWRLVPWGHVLDRVDNPAARAGAPRSLTRPVVR
jgi:hypothetical protein